jgi:hypothetical protein
MNDAPGIVANKTNCPANNKNYGNEIKQISHKLNFFVCNLFFTKMQAIIATHLHNSKKDLHYSHITIINDYIAVNYSFLPIGLT